MELTAGEIAAASSGVVAAGSGDARATSFSIDSRRLEPGACFIALRGTRDGHDFVADAVAGGATVLLVQRVPSVDLANTAVVQVEDPMSALAALARHAREMLSDATVVGITGSAGKTATKDLTAAALRPTFRTHASPSSFNNEAGVPLTLLGAPDDSEVVVAEMGARFAGNLTSLAELARPEVGVITHIGMAHAEHLGGRAGIAKVKGELVEALPSSGLAVLNDDCDESPGLAKRTAARVLRVGSTSRADVRVSDVVLDDDLRPTFRLDGPWGSAPVVLRLKGEHQAINAAMAAAVALDLGAPLASAVQGLAEATPAPNRMELVRVPGDVLVLNDAYNSSPTSAAAAVRALGALRIAGRRIAVLGEMRELGSHANDEHRALGALVTECDVDVLIAVGEPARPIAEGAGTGVGTVLTVPDAEAASAAVAEQASAGDAVLVKASRVVGLERVVEALERGTVTR